jgi:competence protein ComEC
LSPFKSAFTSILCLCLYPQQLTHLKAYNFIIWNVGQGSWSTFIHEASCYHFDMGGEKAPLNNILQLCRRKKNWLLLSHEDWDHLSAIKVFKKKVGKLCLFYPRRPRRLWLNRFPDCPPLPDFIKKLYNGQGSHTHNGKSIVYLLANQVLIPGDSTMKEERIWIRQVPISASILILGHHGSHTSTSEQLLKRVSLKVAVASARKSKYGHPHWKVIRKLRRRGIPLLTTEEQGHIYMTLRL